MAPITTVARRVPAFRLRAAPIAAIAAAIAPIAIIRRQNSWFRCGDAISILGAGPRSTVSIPA